MFATKKIVAAMAAAILLSLNQWTVEAKNLRSNQDKNNALQNQVMEETPDDSGRKLSTIYSHQYKYQEMRGQWLPPFYKYKDTDYRWCVQDDQNSCFPKTIGQSEFWDNDRIKIQDGTVGVGVSCAQRTDIGSGTCEYDSTYSDFWGSVCDGKSYRVYKC